MTLGLRMTQAQVRALLALSDVVPIRLAQLKTHGVRPSVVAALQDQGLVTIGELPDREARLTPEGEEVARIMRRAAARPGRED